MNRKLQRAREQVNRLKHGRMDLNKLITFDLVLDFSGFEEEGEEPYKYHIPVTSTLAQYLDVKRKNESRNIVMDLSD